MANELSDRLKKAVEFLRRNGFAESNADIARKIHVRESTFCMVMNGTRVPRWDLLLDLCDNYPISLRWLRTGEGSMVKEEREIALLRRIEELEKEVERLRSGLHM